MYLPLFPLKSVFYPGETVPLHIFEERYKQLIQDCRSEAATFGIPVFIDNSLVYGTEVQLVEIVNTYEGGEMDVTCIGRQVFKVRTFDSQMEGKLYAGGVVEFLDQDNDADLELRQKVLQKIAMLYELMAVQFYPIEPQNFNSYQLAHKIGLSYAQEYQLLQLTKETARLVYINAHLDKTIEVLEQINKTKRTIQLNGHFKNFDPLDFKDFEV